MAPRDDVAPMLDAPSTRPAAELGKDVNTRTAMHAPVKGQSKATDEFQKLTQAVV